LEGTDREQLTNSSYGVHDFEVNDAGTGILYSELREDESTNLKLLDLILGEDHLLYSCPPGWRCQAADLSPDEKRIAFERLALQEGAGGQWVLGSPQVWLAEIEPETKAMPIGSGNHVTSEPHWSPQGLLAYHDASLKEILISEFRNTTRPVLLTSIPSELGDVGAWSPEGDYLLFPEIVILEGTFELNEDTGDAFPLYYSHLYRFSRIADLIIDLSRPDGDLVEDSSPAYSPDGNWIAFTRRYLEGDRWSQGRQLWIMRTDGSQQRQLTSAPSYNHLSLAWGYDSRRLAYVRTDQLDLTQSPQVWVYDLESESAQALVKGGYLPQWIQ
jgi:Tol biopolymer transport system component